MPQRVAPVDVEAILSTALDTQPDIEAASLIIDQHLLTSGLSAAYLRELERRLAAYFHWARNPQATEIRDGDTAIRYARGTENPYKAQIMALDPTGLLFRVLGGKRAAFRVD